MSLASLANATPTPRHANGMSPTFQTDSYHDQLAFTPIKRRRTSMTWMEGRNLIPKRHLYRMGRQQAEMAAENSKRWPENRGGRRARQRLWLLEQVEMAGYRRLALVQRRASSTALPGIRRLAGRESVLTSWARLFRDSRSLPRCSLATHCPLQFISHRLLGYPTRFPLT